MPRSLPEDPLIRRLVQQARASQVTRRSVLAGGVGGAAALALAACSPGGSGAPSPATDQSDTDKSVTWANWPAYLDVADDGSYPTLEAFTAETGIAVDYLVDINDNNEYYAKIRDQLALGQDIGADLITLTDWMAGRLIRLGYTQELDEANIPNKANLVPDLLDVGFDPGRVHSLPWQGGFAGLCWNKEALPNGLRTLDDLWNPDLAGRIDIDAIRGEIGPAQPHRLPVQAERGPVGIALEPGEQRHPLGAHRPCDQRSQHGIGLAIPAQQVLAQRHIERDLRRCRRHAPLGAAQFAPAQRSLQSRFKIAHRQRTIEAHRLGGASRRAHQRRDQRQRASEIAL